VDSAKQKAARRRPLNSILLIADQVMSFRLSYNGALYEQGISPDLTTLAKIIGGGFPVGAVSGSAKVMSDFSTKAERIRSAWASIRRDVRSPVVNGCTGIRSHPSYEPTTNGSRSGGLCYY
jgi:hypothetical protein